MELLLSIALGVALAAATGLRVFAPLLVAGLAARAGWISLTDAFAWLESTPALLMLSTAALLEALAYAIPGVDHVLDVLAGPAAVVAGALASASVMGDVSPALQWPLAVIAGGGIAGAVKGSVAVVRGKTGIATAGLGNPIVSTFETVGAVTLSLLAVLLPIATVVAIIALLFWGIRKMGRFALGARRKS
ncbi:MAG: DUF4126 domain-containing protein [Gammaproteobacteria bacterium]|nr:DUF4126 domain-containing protein [Gammaproteobacteria bacterium]